MIVVNCRFLTQPITGVQRFAEEVVEALTQVRQDLVLVAPQGELRRAEVGGVPVQQIGSASGHRWEQWDLPRHVRSLDKGTLLLSLMNTGPAFLRRQVVTHHDVTYVRYPQTYSRIFRVAYRVLSAMTLRRARRIVTVSEFSRGEIADVYGVPLSKIDVVPNAAGDQFVAQEVTESSEPFFLAVASVLPHKNLQSLATAYLAFADATGSSTRLKLVGSQPAFSGGTTEQFPTDARIEWLGRVSDEELVQLYAGARALVFPSLYEGFGVPPLEAQAGGCPVISSNAASLPEVLGSSALLFDPRNADDLVARLSEIDSDASLRADLRARGFANVARYSWHDSALRLSQALDRVGQQ